MTVYHACGVLAGVNLALVWFALRATRRIVGLQALVLQLWARVPEGARPPAGSLVGRCVAEVRHLHRTSEES